MCRLRDLIDATPLVAIRELARRGDQNTFIHSLQKSVIPTVINDKFVSFTAWNLDVSGTIFFDAKPDDIINGWEFLANQDIPLVSYAKAFYTTSLFSWLSHNTNDNMDVNEDIVINNTLEPESLELLRLCFLD